jgi:hypothetical protein
MNKDERGISHRYTPIPWWAHVDTDREEEVNRRERRKAEIDAEARSGEAPGTRVPGVANPRWRLGWLIVPRNKEEQLGGSIFQLPVMNEGGKLEAFLMVGRHEDYSTDVLWRWVENARRVHVNIGGNERRYICRRTACTASGVP